MKNENGFYKTKMYNMKKMKKKKKKKENYGNKTE